MLKNLALATMVIIVSACSTYSVDRYSVSTDNVTALKSLEGKTLKLGKFTGTNPGLTEIKCRGIAPIKTPDGYSFENFIENAILDELKTAEMYSSTSTEMLTGHLDSINFSSWSGNWSLALAVKTTNGSEFSVIENYTYTSSFFGETACNKTAQALLPAVQNLIGKVVRSSEFKQLVN